MNADAAEAALAIRPLYARLAADPSQPWRVRADWAVSQRVDHPDAAAASGLALLDLAGGADALTLVAAASSAARGFGLSSPSALASALEDVELDLISMRFDAGIDAPSFAEALAALVESRRLGSAGLDVDLGFDPVALAATGLSPPPGTAAALVSLSARAGLAGRPLLADARPWHEAGAGEARELALVLATAVAHLRTLEGASLSLDAARRAIAVLLPFDADVLLGLAKARAMRRLWSRLEVACGLQPAPLRLHAETSWRMMTRYDPWTNAMRTTAAVFAAGLGGVDTITVLPMTLALGLPDAPARRLARNTGRVLLDEAGFGRVDDPAAGSGALEALTDELCRAAWALFQQVERGGGIEAGLRDGSVRAALAASSDRRRADVETLARGIVGTSRFPSLASPGGSVLDVPRRATSANEGALPSRRDAEPFEILRNEAEARAAAGHRPRVFMATLGEPAAFGERATMAANLLAAAGIATDPPPPAARDVAATRAAFAAGGARVACLCGDDATYATDGGAMVAALRAADAELILAFGCEIAGAETFMPAGKATFQVLRKTLNFASA